MDRYTGGTLSYGYDAANYYVYTSDLYRERTLFASNIYRNTMHTVEVTKIKCHAARTSISPTSWPPCEKKKRKHKHITEKKNKKILRDDN